MTATMLRRSHDGGGPVGGPAHDDATAPPNAARARTQWLVFAAALTVLAGTLVAWGLGRAAARVEVVSLARPVAAGSVLTVDDFTLSSIAVDGAVRGLVPAASLERLVGRTAAIDLDTGVLLTVGMWTDGTQVLTDEQTVGAVLEPGRFPNGLAPGGQALAVSTGADVDTAVAVRLLDAELDDTGRLHVTLAAPALQAVDLARLAALDGLVLVGLPATAAAEEAG